jgi:acyl dehydratase
MEESAQMEIDPRLAAQVGKRYPPVVYAVGREKVREYTEAVGECNPVYLDVEAARAAGYSDTPAPPMFACVYAGRALPAGLFDPDLEIDFGRLVHGAQQFAWPGPVVVAGDEITTVLSVGSISARAGLRFYVFESESVNQHGEVVCTGVWTNIIRGTE